MGLIIPQELISSLKSKYLLLDTNIFIDAFLHPNDFSDFFNTLKENDITLVTIDLVKIEFLRGSQDDATYKFKEEYLHKITKIILPTDEIVIKNAYELLKKYREFGKTVAMADFYLGANLMRYKGNLYLLTRNTKEFPSSIFNLKHIVNYPLSKGIFTYGIYEIRT